MEDVVLRKPGSVLLRTPVLLGGVVASAVRRHPAARAVAVVTTAATAALLVMIALPPVAGVAVPASTPAPVSADLFAAVGTAHDPAAPLTLAFDQPMDPASVAAALAVVPPAPFTMTWDPTRHVARLMPDGYWRPDTLYRVLVGPGARSGDGGQLASPLRRVVLTARAGRSALAPTMMASGGTRLDSSFRIRVDRPVTIEAVRAAFRSEPPIRGELSQDGGSGVFRFDPTGPLAAATTYRLWLGGLRDTSGVPFQPMAPVQATTVAAPTVTTIRPRAGARSVARDADVAIGFSATMDRGATEDAVEVRAGGTRVATRTTWSADGRTLVVRPVTSFPYGARVTVMVRETARSTAGAPLASPATSRFAVRPKPVRATEAIPTGAGGAVGGSWLAVERYYLRLMNCTRQGGWVTAGGACSSPGGRNVAPLRLNATISARASRPYARLLATRGACDHFIGGNPGDRLRKAGYRGYNWGENIGCRAGSPYASVLGTHLFYQSEKSYNGGHYRNLMNPAFRQVGIGVWVSGGRVRLVIDFYGG